MSLLRFCSKVTLEPMPALFINSLRLTLTVIEGAIAPRVIAYRQSYNCFALPLKSPAGTASRVIELATF